MDDLLDGKFLAIPGPAQISKNGIATFSDWFNLESNWVVHSILQAQMLADRVQKLNFFIAVMSKCVSMQNFSSAMSIYSALSRHAIQRLSWTWCEISQKAHKRWHDTEKLFCFQANFGVYRDVLKHCSTKCIPVLTVLTRDLTHIEERFQKYAPAVDECAQRVNFQRFSALADHLLKFREYQAAKFDYDTSIRIQLELIPEVGKDEVYELSYQLEPQYEEKKRRKSKPEVRNKAKVARSAIRLMSGTDVRRTKHSAQRSELSTVIRSFTEQPSESEDFDEDTTEASLSDTSTTNPCAFADSDPLAAIPIPDGDLMNKLHSSCPDASYDL